MIEETNVWVGEGAPAKAAPAKFPYVTKHSPRVDYFEYIVEIPTILSTDEWPELCFATHATVVDTKGSGGGQTAWGDGEKFSSNWAMKFCESLYALTN